MQESKSRNKILFILFLSILISCSGVKESTSDSSSTSFTCTATVPPVFNGEVDTILATNCVSCHSTYNTYSGAAAEASAIATSVNNGSMPPSGGLSTANQTAIIQWVACGTNQN